MARQQVGGLASGAQADVRLQRGADDLVLPRRLEGAVDLVADRPQPIPTRIHVAVDERREVLREQRQMDAGFAGGRGGQMLPQLVRRDR